MDKSTRMTTSRSKVPDAQELELAAGGTTPDGHRPTEWYLLFESAFPLEQVVSRAPSIRLHSLGVVARACSLGCNRVGGIAELGHLA